MSLALQPAPCFELAWPPPHATRHLHVTRWAETTGRQANRAEETRRDTCKHKGARRPDRHTPETRCFPSLLTRRMKQKRQTAPGDQNPPPKRRGQSTRPAPGRQPHMAQHQSGPRPSPTRQRLTHRAACCAKVAYHATGTGPRAGPPKRTISPSKTRCHLPTTPADPHDPPTSPRLCWEGIQHVGAAANLSTTLPRIRTGQAEGGDATKDSTAPTPPMRRCATQGSRPGCHLSTSRGRSNKSWPCHPRRRSCALKCLATQLPQ